MKILHISAVFIAVLFTGCFFSTPTPESKIDIARVCNSAKYNVAIGSIQPGKDNTFSASDFKVLLDRALFDSGCFNVQSKHGEKTYTLNVKYNFEISRTIEDTSVISSKDNVMLKSNVQLILAGKAGSIQQSATSTLKLSEKKYLGLGDNIQVTAEQKENVLRRTLNTIFTNLSSMPN